MTLADLLEQPALRLLEIIRRAVAASDDVGRIVYVNAQFCREFLAPPEQLVGIIAPEYLPEPARSSWIAHSRHWRRGVPRALYASLPDGAGALHPYLVLPYPLANREGRHLGIVASFVRVAPDNPALALGTAGDESGTLRLVLQEIASQLSDLLSASSSAGGDLDALRPSIPELTSLTEREWAVASRVARGDRTRLIAAELDIRENTVRNHLKAIFRKTGVRRQSELIERFERWRAGRNAPH